MLGLPEIRDLLTELDERQETNPVDPAEYRAVRDELVELKERKVAAALEEQLRPNQRAFLDAFAECGTVSAACRKAGVSSSMPYEWNVDDPVFSGAFQRARDAHVDAMEAAARGRAMEGWSEPVFHNGRLVGSKQKFSDSLLMFLLRGERPQKFAAHQVVESHVSGEVVHRAADSTIQLDAVSKIRELRERREALLSPSEAPTSTTGPLDPSNASYTPSRPSPTIFAGHDLDSEIIDAEIVD